MNSDVETRGREDAKIRSREGRSGSSASNLTARLARGARRVWYSLVWCVCWVICKVWFRLEATGRTMVPAAGPVLLVSNHQSHLDPVLVGVGCPRQLRPLARRSLFFWPLSWLIRSLGAVPIDRDGSGVAGVKAMLKLLREGEAVLVFPEGTRTPHGTLQRLLPGFCALARRGGATIVPVAIDGAFAAMPRGSSFPRPRRIRLRFSPPIEPAEIARLADDELIELATSRIAAGLENG